MMKENRLPLAKNGSAKLPFSTYHAQRNECYQWECRTDQRHRSPIHHRGEQKDEENTEAHRQTGTRHHWPTHRWFTVKVKVIFINECAHDCIDCGRAGSTYIRHTRANTADDIMINWYVLDLAKVLIVRRLSDANADAEQCEGHKNHGYRRADVEESIGNDVGNAAEVHRQLATERFRQQTGEQVPHWLCDEHYAAYGWRKVDFVVNELLKASVRLV